MPGTHTTSTKQSPPTRSWPRTEEQSSVNSNLALETPAQSTNSTVRQTQRTGSVRASSNPHNNCMSQVRTGRLSPNTEQNVAEAKTKTVSERTTCSNGSYVSTIAEQALTSSVRDRTVSEQLTAARVVGTGVQHSGVNASVRSVAGSSDHHGIEQITKQGHVLVVKQRPVNELVELENSTLISSSKNNEEILQSQRPREQRSERDSVVAAKRQLWYSIGAKLRVPSRLRTNLRLRIITNNEAFFGPVMSNERRMDSSSLSGGDESRKSAETQQVQTESIANENEEEVKALEFRPVNEHTKAEADDEERELRMRQVRFLQSFSKNWAEEVVTVLSEDSDTANFSKEKKREASF